MRELQQNRIEKSRTTRWHHSILFIICSVWISGFYLIYMIHSKENSIRHSFVYFRFYFGGCCCFVRCSVWKWVWFSFASLSRLPLCHCCSSYCLCSLRWLLTVTLWRYDCVYCKPKLFMRAAFFLLLFTLALLDSLFFRGFLFSHCMELTSKNFVICLLQAAKTILPN